MDCCIFIIISIYQSSVLRLSSYYDHMDISSQLKAYFFLNYILESEQRKQ